MDTHASVGTHGAMEMRHPGPAPATRGDSDTPAATATSFPPVIAVAGMHRSGTSLAASLLHTLGIRMGAAGEPFLRADRGNVRGYFEDVEFVELQRRMLAAASRGTAAAWPDIGWPPVEPDDLYGSDAFAEEAVGLVARRAAKGVPWGWKDPRSSLLLDFWLRLLPSLRVLVVYRSPWEVSRSLRRIWGARLRSQPSASMQIWTYYNSRILNFLDSHRQRCVVVEASSLVNDPLAAVRVIRDRLGLDLPYVRRGESETWESAARRLTAGLVEPELLLHRSPPRELPAEALRIWCALEERADLPSGPVGKAGIRFSAIALRRAINTTLLWGAGIPSIRALRGNLLRLRPSRLAWARAELRQLPISLRASPFLAHRAGGGPLISATLFADQEGVTINGPSPLRVPAWVRSPLGRYYLYFSHHRGESIRLAYADSPEGPWRIHGDGVLHLRQTPCADHIASPDVHVDEGRQLIRMYYHGQSGGNPREQATYCATSSDGLCFSSACEPLGPSYFRVFAHEGRYYAIAKGIAPGGRLLRSHDPEGPFEAGPAILPRMRHAAVLCAGTDVWVFYSRVGDAPESILVSRLKPGLDWARWRATPPSLVLAPELPWEGAALPRTPSLPGSAREPVRQLRDPAILVCDTGLWLFYAYAGERGLALARLRCRA